MNPTIDQVLDILANEVNVGSNLPIQPNPRDILSGFREAFETRLAAPNSWDRDGSKVRNAARQVGVIATSIALIQQKTFVTNAILEEAVRIVKTQCRLGFDEGQWCMP